MDGWPRLERKVRHTYALLYGVVLGRFSGKGPFNLGKHNPERNDDTLVCLAYLWGWFLFFFNV